VRRTGARLLGLAAGTALFGAGCLQGPGASPVDPFKPANQALGERIFRDPRFSQWFATHSTNVNAFPTPGDPTVANSDNALGPDMPGSLAVAAMACSLCHLVEQNAAPDGTNMRAYADYAQRSPIPDRGDGQTHTPRNSPPMVDSLVPHDGPTFLHLDGQFVSPADLIAFTFTGRNLGWLPTEYAQAVAHIANVIRGDDCTQFIGPDPGLAGTSYAADFLGQDARILARLLISKEDRLDVHTATDAEVLQAVGNVVAAYISGLRYSRDTSGAYDFSPFDVFLKLNGLPRKPDDGEAPLDYAHRLRTAVETLASPQWVTPDMGSYTHHSAPFAFGPSELQGLEIFLAEPPPGLTPPATAGAGGVGNCLSCHTPPDFTDHAFHSTGASQLEYDDVHGQGAFVALRVPDLVTRNANPLAYLPASVANPTARGTFRSAPSAEDATLADLGLWNVFANSDIPNPQSALLSILCTPTTPDCSPATLLPKTLTLFKTPGLRDIDDSAPYLHNGTAQDLQAVLAQYEKVSDLQRAGRLRNGDARLGAIHLGPQDLPPLEAFLHSMAEDYQ
jgi:hypothetical protein